EAESRIRSLESSILYLQEQHADTLRGLHQEMSRLQTKCSELNFRLSMSSSASAVDDPATTAATAGVARPAKLALLDRERGNRVDELRRALANREKEVADLRAKVDALTAKYDASERRNVAYEAELDQLRAFHAAATAAAAAAVSASSLSSPSPPPPPSTADAGGSSSLNSSAGPVFIRRLPLPAKTGGSQQPPQQQQHQQPANLILQASAMIPTAAPPHLRALSGGASTGFKGSGVVLPPITRRHRLPQLQQQQQQPPPQPTSSIRVSDRKETEVIERIDLMGGGAAGASGQGATEGNGATKEQPSSN
ncbi:hypothetical protein BOX15_Mlig024147g1, partial [Macrostomum lignano]